MKLLSQIQNCICEDCDIFGCNPDCDPCFGVLPKHVQRLIRHERSKPYDEDSENNLDKKLDK